MEKKEELSLKMKDNQLRFFLIEIAEQIRMALTALDELDTNIIEYLNLWKEWKAIFDTKQAQEWGGKNMRRLM